VFVHPLSWHRQLPGAPGFVLGYAAHPPDQLREAARRIGRVLGTGAPREGAQATAASPSGTPGAPRTGPPGAESRTSDPGIGRSARRGSPSRLSPAMPPGRGP
jgi:hypothetical protein